MNEVRLELEKGSYTAPEVICNIMKLTKDEYMMSETICDITKDLDHMSKLDTLEEYDSYHHCIYFSRGDIKKHLLYLRVLGETVGSIEFDDNFIIKSISVDSNPIVRTYPTDVNEEIKKKYIGSKLILPKEIIEKYEFEDFLSTL